MLRVCERGGEREREEERGEEEEKEGVGKREKI